jgi:hypothetical protein
MHLEATTGRFGFHLAGGKDEAHPTSAFVQMYVKSSALSRVADLAISTHLMTAREIDQFIREAVTAPRSPWCRSEEGACCCKLKLTPRPEMRPWNRRWTYF